MFRQATSNAAPLPYQQRLALADPFPTLLDVPTGLGKTAAAILAWVWRRRFAEESNRRDTPRRLVYCLPMRVLVEQTFIESVKWLNRLGLLAGSAEWTHTGDDGLPTTQAQLKRAESGGWSYRPEPDATQERGWATDHDDHGQQPIAVHLLLGGEEKTDWALWPELDAILIGTQDMLLSRALNRGYAAGRARWPLEFGLLNNDCLWVFDEIQLMDTGLATSLQLDAWRCELCLRSSRSEYRKAKSNHVALPSRSLWMSATMARHWLDRAVDWSSWTDAAWQSPHRVQLGTHVLPGGQAEADDTSERVIGLFANKKTLEKQPVACLTVRRGRDSEPDVPAYLDKLVPAILKHKAAEGLTLVIVNTVDRAVGVFRKLKERDRELEVFLIHSRFRPMERERWAEFLGRKDGRPRVVVSTQVVEAGVDLSAKVLFTELGPWASLVQRFGRCARYPGEAGIVFWMDLAVDERVAAPYDVAALTAARTILEREEVCDVGLQSLKTLRSEFDQQATTLFPYDPRYVPHEKDLFDLFDTTPDLTGADVDISKFIRDGEELDVQVFWRELPPEGKPAKKDRPHRRELCPVPFLHFRALLPTLRKAGRVSRRNYRKGWEAMGPRDADQVYPGQVYLLERACGGYHQDLGWTGETDHAAFRIDPCEQPEVPTAQDDEDDLDDLCQISKWLTVEEHTQDVCRMLEELLPSSGLTASEAKVLRLAARLHDWGKAHPAFQAKLKPEMLADAEVQRRLAGQPTGKAPSGKSPTTQQVDEARNAWRKDKLKPREPETEDHRRPGFRHELASALAILEALRGCRPDHSMFAWPDGLNSADFRAGAPPVSNLSEHVSDHPLIAELAALSDDELDLLIYIVAAHHGKVRMSLRSSPDDDRTSVPDPCPGDKRQARGVRDADLLPACRIPAADLKGTGIDTPAVTLSLDLMELGLSPHYGASWRERMQLLLERLGPFRLGYLEALLRAADCRASAEEDQSSYTNTGEA
jgi:CRISPR-associated endonuclease/helicase Cas3